MILEMALYRGTMVWLNGKTPPGKWQCGLEDSVMTCLDLVIDGHKITKIEAHGPKHDDCDPDKGAFYIFEDAIVPESITLTTDKSVFKGPIGEIVVQKPDFEETSVTLENGEEYDIDEITLYLKAVLTEDEPAPVA